MPPPNTSTGGISFDHWAFDPWAFGHGAVGHSPPGRDKIKGVEAAGELAYSNSFHLGADSLFRARP